MIKEYVGWIQGPNLNIPERVIFGVIE